MKAIRTKPTQYYPNDWAYATTICLVIYATENHAVIEDYTGHRYILNKQTLDNNWVDASDLYDALHKKENI